MRTPRPAIVAITAAVVAGVVALPTGVGLAAYYHDKAHLKVLPRHSMVGGVDVSGLDRAHAIAKVRAAVDQRLQRPATLIVADHRYTTTLRDLGVRDNVESAVDAAFRATHGGSFLSRTWHRLFGGQPKPIERVRYTKPSAARLRAVVDRAVRSVAVRATNASAYLSGGFVSFTAAKPGRSLDRAAALAALQASLSDGIPRRVDPHVEQPAVDDAAYDTVIVVHIGENRLYLYKHQKIARTFRVATGQSRYPTPTGEFTVTLKRYLPTWYNPHDEWSRDEPETIPPGPNNPLGLRALNLSAPGIRIHGSPADYSIGYNASHGCIRMHNSDVVQLFPLVPTGTRVFITQVGPYRPIPAKAVKQAPKKAPVVNAEGG